LAAVGIGRVAGVAVGIGRVAGVAVGIGRVVGVAVGMGWIGTGTGGMEQKAGGGIGRMKSKQGAAPAAGATKTPTGSCLILLQKGRHDRAPEEHTHGVSCGGA
jgi:hypothetical protein